MADEIHDLLVKVRPDTGDTEQALDGVSDKFNETADETERTAQAMNDMSRRLQGLGAVIVASLATVAAGIASKVPVLQESATGLEAVMTSLALAADRDLRPSVNLVNLALFDLAEAIAKGEGVLGEFLDVFGSLLIAIGREFPTELLTAQQGLDKMLVALGLTAINWEEIWSGMMDTVSGFVDDVVGFFRDLPGRIGSAVSSIKRELIQNFVNPVIEQVNKAIEALNKLPGANFDTFNTVTFGPEQPFGGRERGADGLRPNERQAVETLERMAVGSVDAEFNISGERVATATKPFVVRGTLSRGRGMRMR